MHLFVVKFIKILNNSFLNGLIFSQQLYIDEYYFKMHFLKKYCFTTLLQISFYRLQSEKKNFVN